MILLRRHINRTGSCVTSGHHLCSGQEKTAAMLGNGLKTFFTVQWTEYFFVQTVGGVFEDFVNTLKTAVSVEKIVVHLSLRKKQVRGVTLTDVS